MEPNGLNVADTDANSDSKRKKTAESRSFMAAEEKELVGCLQSSPARLLPIAEAEEGGEEGEPKMVLSTEQGGSLIVERTFASVELRRKCRICPNLGGVGLEVFIPI